MTKLTKFQIKMHNKPDASAIRASYLKGRAIMTKTSENTWTDLFYILKEQYHIAGYFEEDRDGFVRILRNVDIHTIDGCAKSETAKDEAEGYLIQFPKVATVPQIDAKRQEQQARLGEIYERFINTRKKLMEDPDPASVSFDVAYNYAGHCHWLIMRQATLALLDQMKPQQAELFAAVYDDPLTKQPEWVAHG